jgi:hypothetical protein
VGAATPEVHFYRIKAYSGLPVFIGAVPIGMQMLDAKDEVA